MLRAVDIEIRDVEHSITEEYSTGSNIYTEVGADLIAQAGGGITTAVAHSETLKTTYKTVDVDDSEEFLEYWENIAKTVFLYLITSIISHRKFNSSSVRS